jgi:aconitate hydratase
MKDSFSTHDTLTVNGRNYRFASLARLESRFDLKRLPYSMKILLENLLRHEDGSNVSEREIAAVAGWKAGTESETEIAFMPARVVLQDFTGVPCRGRPRRHARRSGPPRRRPEEDQSAGAR